MAFRKGTVVMRRSSVTRVVASTLVASQLLTGLPALAAARDHAPQQQMTNEAESRKQEKPRAPNRTVPKVDAPPTLSSLPASPTDADLTRARVFAEPLVPMPRGTTEAENRALARA